MFKLYIVYTVLLYLKQKCRIHDFYLQNKADLANRRNNAYICGEIRIRGTRPGQLRKTTAMEKKRMFF